MSDSIKGLTEVFSAKQVFVKSDLNKAIKNKEFTLHYQPQILSKTGEIYGFEALVRWKHSSFGMVSPGEFIPFAESTGLIVPLGKWIVETACHQIKEWQLLFKKPFKIAVNFSIKQFTQPNLIEIVTGALEKSGLDPCYLDIEITESVTENITIIIDTVKQLKALGVGISIDDFGKGFSSLYYLKELPVDKLKLDRCFIIDIHSKKDQTIVKSMISMARKLNVEVVAEGIETEEQFNIFSKQCEYLQGFYISKPLPRREVNALLETLKRTS